ncbi:Protein T12B3.3 [Aphelenchoides avenae]|nr:Protein T12B3.3 [Aphelenchus avenae]
MEHNALTALLAVLLKWPVLLPLLAIIGYLLFKNRPANRRNVERFFQGFRIGGHRGSPVMQPENTMASMEQAKTEGADLIEFDVSLTKDGVAVLLHDDTLDRTTNLTGPIREKYFKDLQSTCNAAAKFAGSGTDTNATSILPMPTLDELVEWAKASKMKMLFDVKDADRSLVLKLEELFAEHDIYDWGIVCSFFPSVIYRIKRHNPRILTGLTWRRWFASFKDLEAKTPRYNGMSHYLAVLIDVVYVFCVKTWLPDFLGADMVLTERSEISAAFVERQLRNGRKVCAWTVNDVNEINWMRHTLEIPLLTDKPFLARKVDNAAEPSQWKN